MKKKALGTGLKAFIPEEYGILKDEAYAELDIEQIKPNPLQARQKFDKGSIDELARSIKESGVLQPIIVTPEGNTYKIIVGERRWRAAQKAGLKKIPSLIRPMPKTQQLETSLVENLQREDLNPLEIALSYQRLTQELNCTQQEIAEKVGKDRTSVANYLRLLKLPKEIQENLAAGNISMGHARALAGLDNTSLQITFGVRIAQQGLSVRQAEALVARSKSDERRAPARRAAKPPNILDLEQQMTRAVSTRVQIHPGRKKGTGKIVLEFYSLDDFERILDRICGADRESL